MGMMLVLGQLYMQDTQMRAGVKAVTVPLSLLLQSVVIALVRLE